MKYLSPTQIEQFFNEKTTEQQLEIYKKAFGLKETDNTLSRIDCIAMAMDYVKCISGSGFYENVNV